ncbi:MAG: hypothetical protein WCC37_23885 [Candidatus Sulfotelmatobacter sp.]|jgi:hypothetical protein
MEKLRERKGKADTHDLIFPAENRGVQGHSLRILKNFLKENDFECTWELHKFRKTLATFKPKLRNLMRYLHSPVMPHG